MECGCYVSLIQSSHVFNLILVDRNKLPGIVKTVRKIAGRQIKSHSMTFMESESTAVHRKALPVINDKTHPLPKKTFYKGSFIPNVMNVIKKLL